MSTTKTSTTEQDTPQDEKVTCRKCGHTYTPNFIFDFYPDGKDPKVGLCERCMVSEALAPKPIGSPHVEKVCKPFQGATTCAFLVMGAGQGNEAVYQCVKGTNTEQLIRQRLAKNTIRAHGDNCLGPPTFAPNP